jgi:hypothetical protein
MNVHVTVTSIKQKDTTTTVARDMYLVGQELELFAQGTVLAICNPMSKTTYITDFAWSSVAAVLAAAPGTGGFFALT